MSDEGRVTQIRVYHDGNLVSEREIVHRPGGITYALTNEETDHDGWIYVYGHTTGDEETREPETAVNAEF